jgi:hypothetical protein
MTRGPTPLKPKPVETRADSGLATKAVLMLAYLVAAAIVIPVVARRLAG